ncbi:hypothetical protein F2Q69_00033577 [Brassica cretica]|uniref:Uncharacterized protein n=1 Tax=Brassica cretica TaxID=69181 RepID=A0A8S9SDE0_BRACR|nr:hypothetical protein F2Q69_00033577 [Brassica cretica]
MSLHVPIRQFPMFPHDHIFLRPSHMPLRQAGALQELGSSRRDNVVLLSWYFLVARSFLIASLYVSENLKQSQVKIMNLDFSNGSALNSSPLASLIVS